MTTTETTRAPLTPSDVWGLHAILQASVSHARVRRLMPDGEVVAGTARYLSGDDDAPRPDDIRDCFLRVTTVNGWETWWPVAEIARQSQIGEFAVDGES